MLKCRLRAAGAVMAVDTWTLSTDALIDWWLMARRRGLVLVCSYPIDAYDEREMDGWHRSAAAGSTVQQAAAGVRYYVIFHSSLTIHP
jgi:hypothetical protein